MTDIVGIVIACIVGLALLIGVLLVPVYFIDKYKCNKLASSTGIETKYVMFGGNCLVRVNDRFIPQENWRGEYQQ